MYGWLTKSPNKSPTCWSRSWCCPTWGVNTLLLEVPLHVLLVAFQAMKRSGHACRRPLIRARRGRTHEIDALSLMMTSDHWIPVEGIHELPLVHALVTQRRRFAKPLRYDAKSVASFPNALLLDAGSTPMPLHVVSAFMPTKERDAKVKAAQTASGSPWLWWTNEAMPTLPLVLTR